MSSSASGSDEHSFNGGVFTEGGWPSVRETIVMGRALSQWPPGSIPIFSICDYKPSMLFLLCV